MQSPIRTSAFGRLQRKYAVTSPIIQTPKMSISFFSATMAPDTEKCPLPDSDLLPDGIVVSDIIYNPRETVLLRKAREKGLKTIGGLPMLLYQAADAFKLFTGYDMPVDEVKKRVEI